MDETILTVPEAAEYLGVTKRIIWKWIQNGSLGCYRIGDGRTIRVGTSHLQEYLKNHEVPNNECQGIEETA